MRFENRVVGLASDHAGYVMKETVKDYLLGEGIEYLDYGVNRENVEVDYPEYVVLLGEGVVKKQVGLGVAICGTGIGVSIVANKVRGVYCALCGDEYMAKHARLHNNANVLGLGARVLGMGLALSIVKIFLETSFEGGRHERRVEKVLGVEKYFLMGDRGC